ncbi:MAG: MazG nucleotide pyrophosphohydrolase domain-containing protein [Microgenomates group bacterium]
MNSFQKQIKTFVDARNWDQFQSPKDLLLGIVEEIGELRNIIKWEQDPEVINKVILDNKDEFEDNIGDIYWFLAVLANKYDIDLDQAITKVIKSNQKRFPIKQTKNHHTNLKLGGIDKQYKKKA